MVVVMENLGYDEATTLPGYRALARRYAVATDAYAAAHPSLPNYLDLVAGSTFGITSDCTSCYVDADNLAAQLTAAHVAWGDYSEGLPRRCYLGPYAGLYAGKHNPFRYFTDVRDDPALCAHLLALSALTWALRSRPAAVPRFSFVTPNLCHDGHNCPPARALTWLAGFLREVTSSRAWGGGWLVVVTWDEGNGGDDTRLLPSGRVLPTGGGGHIPTLLVAPGVAAGTRVTTPLSHDAVLATVEADFHLPYLRGARAWARRRIHL